MKKLLKIQEALKAPKNQFNSFGKYKYRNQEDILEALEKVDSLIDESKKYSQLKMEIEGRILALVPLLSQWEKELKKMITEDKWIEVIRIQEKHIVQLNAEIELLTELKAIL